MKSDTHIRFKDIRPVGEPLPGYHLRPPPSPQKVMECIGCLIEERLTRRREATNVSSRSNERADTTETDHGIHDEGGSREEVR